MNITIENPCFPSLKLKKMDEESIDKLNEQIDPIAVEAWTLQYPISASPVDGEVKAFAHPIVVLEEHLGRMDFQEIVKAQCMHAVAGIANALIKAHIMTKLASRKFVLGTKIDIEWDEEEGEE